MTAANDGDYGAVFLTPDRMVDFSSGTATITWKVSTYRASVRDWWDFTLTPFEDNLVSFGFGQIQSGFPCPSGAVDFFGSPRNSINFEAMGDYHFNFTISGSNHAQPFCTESGPGSGFPSVTRLVQNVSAVRRDTFEVNISQTHVRMGMYYQNFNPMDGHPGDCDPGSANFCRHNWVDRDLNPPLPWTRAVLTFGHHSYNPCKDGAGCENTWHWGDVYISSAVPFSINQGARWVKGGGPQVVNFDHPTVDNSYLRFEGISNTPIQYSLDDGATWSNALQREVAATWRGDSCHARSYWTPIPAGTQRLQLRGTTSCGGSWIARDVTAWSPGVFDGEADAGTDAGVFFAQANTLDAGMTDPGLFVDSGLPEWTPAR